MRKRQAKKLSKCPNCEVGKVLKYRRCSYNCGKTIVHYSFFECDCCLHVYDINSFRTVHNYGVPK